MTDNKLPHLTKRLNWARIFDADASYPQTEDECMDYLFDLCMELSPENLTCDGELNRAQIKARSKEIWATWSEVESILGRKVDMDEAESVGFGKMGY